MKIFFRLIQLPFGLEPAHFFNVSYVMVRVRVRFLGRASVRAIIKYKNSRDNFP